MTAVRNIRPDVTVSPMADMPAGLNASEELAYRKGHSRGMALYVKKAGGPGISSSEASPRKGDKGYAAHILAVHESSAAWYGEHGESRHTAAHKAGMSSLRAYLKRHGLADRFGPARVPRKPAARKLASVPDVAPVVEIDPTSVWAPVQPWNRVSYGMSKDHDIPARVDMMAAHGPGLAPTFTAVIARRADNKARNRELAAEMRDAGIPITVETWNAAKAGTLAGIGDAP